MVTGTSRNSTCLQGPGTHYPKAIIAGGYVLWSSGSAWTDVIAEACRFENFETVEFEPADHCLVLHLSTPALVELKANGRCDTRTRVPGDLTIFPAGTACLMCSRGPLEVLMVSISQRLMIRSGFETGRARFEPPLSLYVQDGQLEHICRALKAEAESKYVSGPLYGASLALALAAHLLQKYCRCDSASGRKGGM